MASGNGQGNNGHRPGPIGVVPQNHVPIIGAPFELKSYFLTLSLLCRCDQAHPEALLFAGMIGGMVQCPRCKCVHVLVGVRQDPQNPTQLQFTIKSGIITPKGEAPDPPAPPATEPTA